MPMLILLSLLALAVVALALRAKTNNKQLEQGKFEDAIADARRWTERLGSQVLTIAGTDAASTQAIADASERYTAASSQIAQATTVRQAELARESALEGLYYMHAAREIMGLPAGPELPLLEGQKKAGKVTETRTITQENGQVLTASPVATDVTPNYYPGGVVAGRPVPAGWYSAPWWADAMLSGVWTGLSFAMWSSLFTGMSGINSDAWSDGYADGYQEGLDAADSGADADFSDAGSDDGGFFNFDGFGDFGGDGFDFDF
ncbi:DUF1542 domain-containing protein [Corynebacterium sp. sy039]|uniref:DUF1542 domain-containing protein n=1 Tax=Corynebacterium sp. sy039 TaxID=2599641 RepID=UPI0011B452C7|nr:DUF1542 domain-containing protein [Corynebacterium sp. sy039]